MPKTKKIGRITAVTESNWTQNGKPLVNFYLEVAEDEMGHHYIFIGQDKHERGMDEWFENYEQALNFIRRQEERGMTIQWIEDDNELKTFSYPQDE